VVARLVIWFGKSRIAAAAGLLRPVDFAGEIALSRQLGRSHNDLPRPAAPAAVAGIEAVVFVKLGGGEHREFELFGIFGQFDDSFFSVAQRGPRTWAAITVVHVSILNQTFSLLDQRLYGKLWKIIPPRPSEKPEIQSRAHEGYCGKRSADLGTLFPASASALGTKPFARSSEGWKKTRFLLRKM